MTQSFLKDIEWSLLRSTLIFAIACFALGLSVLIVSYEYKLTKEEAAERQQLNFHQLKSKTNKAIRDIDTYKKYFPFMNEYIDLGYIGQENRVLWIDILRDITTELKLPNLQYEISEQTPYVHKGPELPVGDFSIVKSIMQISMNIYHEGDLLTLLDTLTERSKALFYIDKCSVRRVRSIDSSNLDDANLNAQCNLVWISVQYPQLLSKDSGVSDEN